MKLLKQPNGWSCLLTSFAMALETTVPKLISLVGHDGSAIAFPGESEPHSRRCFHLDELRYAALQLGWAATQFELNPSGGLKSGKSIKIIYPEGNEARMFSILKARRGVLIFDTHAAAWDGTTVFDPNGSVYRINRPPQTFVHLARVAPDTQVA